MDPQSPAAPRRIAIFGASGGIGAALGAALLDRSDGAVIYAAARHPPAPRPGLIPLAFDLLDEASIAAAAATIGAGGPLDLVLVATGALVLPGGSGPEKSLRALDPAAMAQAFALNTIGPALIAKHLLPILARDRRAVFAALSARVGSITDNRLGGWHSYRASKAALNMVVRNCAIELGRSHPQAIAVTLHPGTVDTALSAPFQRGVAAQKLFTAGMSAGHLLAVIDCLTPADSGGLFAWDGARIAY